MQCDGDIIGSTLLTADADVINLAVAGLSAVGFTEFVIRINHRNIIKGIAEELGYKDKEGVLRIQRALDCADKFGKSQASVSDFAQKLRSRGFTDAEIEKIAKAYGMEKDVLKSALRPEDTENITKDIKVQKAVQFIKDNAVEA